MERWPRVPTAQLGVGSFRLNALVRILLAVIVVIVWITGLATAFQTRSIQPVAIAILVTLTGGAAIYPQMERSTDGERQVEAFLRKTLEARPIDENGAQL